MGLLPHCKLDDDFPELHTPTRVTGWSGWQWTHHHDSSSSGDSGDSHHHHYHAIIMICADDTTLHPTIIFKSQNFMTKWADDNVATAL